MVKKEIEVDIKVPNQTRYLSLIGRIGEDIAKELDKYDGDRETLAYHINLCLPRRWPMPSSMPALKIRKNWSIF